MRSTFLALSRFVSLVILFVSLATCDELKPFCHPSLGQNLNRMHCLEAFRQFRSLLDVSKSPSSAHRLPMMFSYQGCTITINSHDTREMTQTSWVGVGRAISSIQDQCVARPSSTGGIVTYHGFVTSITQRLPHRDTRAAHGPLPSHETVPIGFHLKDINDLVDHLDESQAAGLLP
jgi:hypothetical protein